MAGFRALDLGLELIRGLRQPVASIRRRSGRLALQIEAVASSIVLNLGEGSRRIGKDRLHHYRIAAGSADEVRCALLVAEAWGYVDANHIAGDLELLDGLLAMLWSLGKGARRE